MSKELTIGDKIGLYAIYICMFSLACLALSLFSSFAVGINSALNAARMFAGFWCLGLIVFIGNILFSNLSNNNNNKEIEIYHLKKRNSKLEALNQKLVDVLKQADITIENLNTQKEKKKSPYEILNIKVGASHDEIKTARNKLVKENHPDKISHMGPEIKAFAEQRIKDINAAYEMLTRGKV